MILEPREIGLWVCIWETIQIGIMKGRETAQE